MFGRYSCDWHVLVDICLREACNHVVINQDGMPLLIAISSRLFWFIGVFNVLKLLLMLSTEPSPPGSSVDLLILSHLIEIEVVVVVCLVLKKPPTLTIIEPVNIGFTLSFD